MDWIRWTAMLALMIALPLGAASTPPPEGSVWIVHNRVEIDIQENYAIVDVIADIGNRGPDPEFPFQVRVPEHAMVTGLWIERDGELWEGRIEDRDAAREEYDGQKQQENTAALIEKSRGTQVYAFLVNVAAFESVTATLRYEIYLAAEQDQFQLDVEAPVSGFGEDQGAAFSARICHSDGIDAAFASSGSRRQADDCQHFAHSVGPRPDDAPTPWSVSYTLSPTSDEGSVTSVVAGGQGYFAHRFRAPADATQLPLDLVLVLDTSGSMGQENKLRQMQDAARQVILMLDDDDRLAIVAFNSQARAEWPGLADADEARRAEALDAIDDFIAAGSTHIEAGLREGFGAYGEACDDALPVLNDCAEERSRILVFLADGVPTQGITDRDDLRAFAKDENPGDVRVFALAFGADADWSLISGMARDAEGAAMRVASGAGAEVDLSRFMRALTTPVLDDVRVDYEGDVQAYRNAAPVLFQGSELLIVGTHPADAETIRGTVTGTAQDGPREYTFNEAAGTGLDILPRIVAYAQIQHYQDLIDAEGENAAWVAEIKGLALEWGFVTDYTSLVLATETDTPVRTYDASAEGDTASDCRGCSQDGAASPSPSPPRSPASPGQPERFGGSSEPGTPAPSVEDEQAPGPGLAMLVVLVAGLGAMLRRRRD